MNSLQHGWKTIAGRLSFILLRPRWAAWWGAAAGPAMTPAARRCSALMPRFVPVERRTTVLSFKTRANDHLLRRCTAGHTSTWHRLAMQLTARDGEDTGRLYTESRAGQGENVWTRTPSDAKELQVLDDAAAVEAVLAGFNGFPQFC